MIMGMREVIAFEFLRRMSKRQIGEFATWLKNNRDNLDFGETPHQCPICFGKGQVIEGFYNSTGETFTVSNIKFESCRSCDGKGIVWRAN